MFSTDFVLNGKGHGPIGELVASTRGDIGLCRPYFNMEDGGRPTVTVNSGRTKRVDIKNKKGQTVDSRYVPIYEEVRVTDLRDLGVSLPPVTNATSLRKEEWLQFDRQVIPPQRNRLRLYNDIASMDTYSFNGMSATILEHETMSDPGKAYQDMNGLSEGTTDTPLFQLEGIPVPITHASFTYDLRRLTMSRNTGTPLNTRGIEWATRRVCELVEDTAIGVAGSPLEYGGFSTQGPFNASTGGYSRASANYGLLNFPARIVKTNNHIPTGANPNAILGDVLAMRDLLYAAKFYGPYGIYHSTDYDQYLDNDYAFTNGTNWATNPSQTLRQRILQIGTEGGMGADTVEERQIRFVKRLDRLGPTSYGSNPFTMIMISLNPNVIRAINGMPITVFQWETKGGWELHFKVACMMLTEMFADYYGNCGMLESNATV